jgi:hypothetical protein
VQLGDGDGARRLLATIPAEHDIVASDPMTVALLADLAVVLADRAWAERLVVAAEKHAGRFLSWGLFGMVWEGPASLWLGGLLATVQRWDEAVDLLEEAFAETERAGARPACVRAGELLAAALIGRAGPDDEARAAALLEASAGEARALGMAHPLARIEAARSTLAPPPHRPDALSFSLSREGELWAIACCGRTLRLRHSRGLELLERLLASPGCELHVLDLVGGGEPIDSGDAGELLDGKAKQAYRRRVTELEEELAEARAWADAGRVARLSAELDFLSDELARGLGLGGRPRHAGGAVERARVNVQKRLKGVIRKIAEGLPELGAHLEKEVRTGTYVSYRRPA